MKEAKVISAFPGCGKTTYYKMWSQYSPENVWRKDKNGEQAYREDGSIIGDKILDSDSSDFSWTFDEAGNRIRHPHFPQNYIDHIKRKMKTEDVIFVSSHDVVRRALEENGIEYHIFYPRKDQKEEWIKRFKERGNDDRFIEFISSNWDNFIDDIENETFPTKHVLHRDGINTEGINSTTMKRAMDYQEG